MIARMWSARATPANASAYLQHFVDAVLPEVRRIGGYAGATALQNEAPGDGVVEIVVITRWTSMDAIREFSGDPLDRAVVTDHARALLESFDDRVKHFRVAADDDPQG
jgi:heme-degrading monooxygenase HmoA